LNTPKLARAIAKFQRMKDGDFIYQIVFYDTGVGTVTDVVPKEDRGWFDFNDNLRRIFTFAPSNAVTRHRCSAQALLTLASPCSVTFLICLLFCQTAETQLSSWVVRL
jgi:hypothetical protein